MVLDCLLSVEEGVLLKLQPSKRIIIAKLDTHLSYS